MALDIYTDGASRGNPGPASWAFLFAKEGNIISSSSGLITRATNNEAEYEAVIQALSAARKEGFSQVHLHSDSELVIRQVTGVYQVRASHLRPFYEKVKRCADAFEEITFSHVKRTHTYAVRADALCNKALDEMKK